MRFLFFRSVCFLRLTLGLTPTMGISAHVLILAGAAIDHNPLVRALPLLPLDERERRSLAPLEADRSAGTA
jgi:hypothetical protein